MVEDKILQEFELKSVKLKKIQDFEECMSLFSPGLVTKEAKQYKLKDDEKTTLKCCYHFGGLRDFFEGKLKANRENKDGFLRAISELFNEDIAEKFVLQEELKAAQRRIEELEANSVDSDRIINEEKLVEIMEELEIEGREFSESYRDNILNHTCDRFNRRGEGSFGTVYSIREEGKGERAYKLYRLDSAGKKKEFMQEMENWSLLSYLSKIQGININKLEKFHLGRNTYADKRRRNVQFDAVAITELYENGSLDEFLTSKVRNSLSSSDKMGLIADIVESLRFLHDSISNRYKFLYLDLKPQNVLIKEVDYQYRAFLTDFGVIPIPKIMDVCVGQTKYMPTRDLLQGTQLYMDPSLIRRMVDPEQKIEKTHKVILYSLAMVTVFIFTGKHPYDGEDNSTVTNNFSPSINPEGFLSPKPYSDDDMKKVPEELQKLVNLWTHHDIMNRPSLKDAEKSVNEILDG